MLKTYEQYNNTQNIWYISHGTYDDVNIDNFICKKISDKAKYFSYILPYNSNFYEHQGYSYAFWVNNDTFNKFDKIIPSIEPKKCNYNTRISNFIIHINEIFHFDDIDYIDIGNDENTISFIPVNKINELKKDENPYNNRFRQSIKIGKFLRKYLIFKNLPEKIIENSTNVLKSYFTAFFSENKIEIVDGLEIKKWYLEKNYVEGGGQLNKSCMKHDTHQHKLYLYVDNPEVCKLSILKDENNKLLGRALIWKTNMGYYMDRIYTVKDKDKFIFMSYASNNNYMLFDNDVRKELVVNIKPNDDFVEFDEYPEPSDYPYMDSFKYYSYEEAELSTRRPFNRYIMLTDF